MCSRARKRREESTGQLTNILCIFSSHSLSTAPHKSFSRVTCCCAADHCVFLLCCLFHSLVSVIFARSTHRAFDEWWCSLNNQPFTDNLIIGTFQLCKRHKIAARRRLMITCGESYNVLQFACTFVAPNFVTHTHTALLWSEVERWRQRDTGEEGARGRKYLWRSCLQCNLTRREHTEVQECSSRTSWKVERHETRDERERERGWRERERVQMVAADVLSACRLLPLDANGYLMLTESWVMYFIVDWRIKH